VESYSENVKIELLRISKLLIENMPNDESKFSTLIKVMIGFAWNELEAIFQWSEISSQFPVSTHWDLGGNSELEIRAYSLICITSQKFDSISLETLMTIFVKLLRTHSIDHQVLLEVVIDMIIRILSGKNEIRESKVLVNTFLKVYRDIEHIGPQVNSLWKIVLRNSDIFCPYYEELSPEISKCAKKLGFSERSLSSRKLVGSISDCFLSSYRPSTYWNY